MATIQKRISTLVNQQLPEFISGEYPKFASFLQKYYEQLELTGQPLDIIQNLTKYNDIDTYEKDILSEFTILTSNVSATASTIQVTDTYAFPETNGYVMIDDEIIFYASKTSTSFLNCKRNLSGTTKLGDLYNASVYKTVASHDLTTGFQHIGGEQAFNISNLFLYAFVKNYESEYLASFPEESLKPEVDKRTLIKNIKQFYRAKGTDQSIEFIFNSIVAQEASDIPSIYYPKDNTLKTSTSNWINKYALRVKIISQINPNDIPLLIGQKLIQEEDIFNSNIKNSFGIIDNILFLGNYDNESIYEIVISPNSIVGEFQVAQKTFLTKRLSPSSTTDNRINVFSTTGWRNVNGKLKIGNEIISFKDKNVNQFIIENRTGNGDYPVNTPVYNYSNLTAEYEKNGNIEKTTFLALGVLYSVKASSNIPYSSEGDVIQISDTGFETRNPIIFNKANSSIRWDINNNYTTSNITGLTETLINISAIYEDDQYYYIASSGYPEYSIGNFANLSPKDQKHLKLIKKESVRNTELYYTDTRDIGIFLNGVLAYGYKDYYENDVIFGGITNISINQSGKGYANAPYVLISGDKGASAKAILSGDVVEKIEIIFPGEKYEVNPNVTITSGRGAVIEATVTKDKVTQLTIVSPGEYYSSPPRIIITDKLGYGRLAEYTAIISSDGKLIGTNKITEGKFYSQENIEVIILPIGVGATATAFTKRWKKNRYEILKNNIDSNSGYLFENIEKSFGYGYAHIGNPISLRNILGDTDSSRHSPILGYAYDGNPIYGPFGYTNPINPNSLIKRIETSYRLNTSRVGGPLITQFPLGSFIEDYRYQHRFGDVDENNGRYCITPDYPDGVYAYFLTVNQNNVSVFPYILGDKYYSLPVESNYTSNVSQINIPLNARRLRTQSIPKNGVGASAIIETTKEGNVSSAIVTASGNTFSVGCNVIVDNTGTNGNGCVAQVSSLKGKNILSIESNQTKAIKIESKSPVYFYDTSLITQENTNATGLVVGDIFSSSNFVLRNVTGNFNIFDKVNSSIQVINLIVDTASFYTDQSIIKLTNGKEVTILSINNNILRVAFNQFANGDGVSIATNTNGIQGNRIYYVINATTNSFQLSSVPNGVPINLINASTVGVVVNSEIARGIILENVAAGNTVRVRVIDGNFIIGNLYYLKSNTIDDTIGSKIFKIDQLSKNVEIFEIDDNIALVTTDANHNITENDKVNIDIIPDDVVTTTNYYVRKRIYQTVKLFQPTINTTINDTGIGLLKVLNTGDSYSNGFSSVFSNVELIFADQTRCRNINDLLVSPDKAFIGSPGAAGNARATITVINGKVSATGVIITTKGSKYKIGDILTVSNQSLARISGSLSSSFLYLEVAHVGFGSLQTELLLTDIDGISVNDILKINEELVKVTAIQSASLSSLSVIRGVLNTTRTNHFTNTTVVSDKSQYNFINDYKIGASSGDAYIKAYNSENQELTVVYDINQSSESINKLSFSFTFFDNSSPRKLVKINSVISEANYKFEFSKYNDSGPWIKNPILEIQKYYKYKFITNHPSLSGSFLEFSPSQNKNIITTETVKGNTLPGSGTINSSYIEIKLGFGSATANNTYTTKKNLDFVSYYYYDKAGIIDSENKYLSVIDDPLQGDKIINYVSPKSFAYSLKRIPEYDVSDQVSAYVSGQVSAYTTSSLFSVGEINSISIDNPGKLYKKLPRIFGVMPNLNFECISEVNYDEDTKKIISILIKKSGSNYSRPAVILITTSNNIPKFNIVKNNNGEIIAIIMEKNNYTFDEKPLIYITETDVEAYLSSDNIGIPKNIQISYSGSNFYNDTSLSSLYTSHQILTISNFSDNAFLNGEIIKQYENQNLIAEGKIASDGYKNGINILKIINVSGEFKAGYSIIGNIKRNTANVSKVFYNLFSSEIKSYYDNVGYYDTDKGQLSSSSQKLADSYFYQDYSYVVKSKSPINIWRKLVKQTVHPSGFKMFGEVSIEASAIISMPRGNNITSHLTVIEIWDDKINRVSIESTKRVITQSILKIQDTNIQRGVGSVFVSESDTSEMLAFNFNLQQSFDGYYNESGNIVGRKSFNMIIPGSNGILNVANVNNLIITIDGIIQEPGVAFTVSNSTLTFARAPLGERIANGQNIQQQKFVGRMIRFKESQSNSLYFKKIQNIENQFNNIETRFSLYYEDGSNAILQSKENLIISLDGVLQNNKITPLFPSTSAYYIDRSVIPNQIVFVDAPRKLNDLNKTRFFGYSIGNYEKIKVDEELFNGNTTGPFLLRAVFQNRPVNLDDDKTILVFIDGILQVRNRAYTISGSSIYFSQAPFAGQKINILYLFGKKSQNVLTFFNFENNRFLNITEIRFVQNAAVPFGEFYEGATVYQGPSLKTATAVGQVIDSSKSGIPRIIIKQNNFKFNKNEDLKVYRENIVDFVFPSNKILIVVEFNQDENKNELVYDALKPSWLRNLQVYPRRYRNIDVEDQIKIDGENDFRKITATPLELKKIGHRSQDIISNNHFGSISVTEYNGVSSGIGLSVVANISNGKISSLMWNKRDYTDIKKVSQSSAYGYINTLELIFVPQPTRDSYGNITGPVFGGGASGYAITNNSEVIDVVLTNPGSEYLVPPKIYVTKKYDIVKSLRNIVTSITNLFLSSEIFTGDSTIYRVNIISPDKIVLSPSMISISDLRSDYKSTDITVTITPIPKVVAISNIIDTQIFLIYATNETPRIVTITESFREITSIIYLDLHIVTIVSSTRESIQTLEFGIVDTMADDLRADKYSQGKLGNRFRVFEDNKFIDTGYSGESKFTLGELDLYYPSLTIEDIENYYETSFTKTKELWTVYIPSIQEYGAILDISLSVASVGGYDNISGFLGQNNLVLVAGAYTITVNVALDGIVTLVSADLGAPSGLYITPGGTRFIYNLADTIVYIPNTSRFSSTGKLLIGDEIVTYTSKLSDRFIGVTRGEENTTIQTHNAGDYLRSIV